MPRLLVQSGVSAPSVTNIPTEWDRQWFRNFITNFMVNMDLRNVKLGTEFVITTNVSGNTTTGETNVPAVSVPIFTSTSPGTVPASGGVPTTFLSATGVWAVPAGGGSSTPGGASTNVQYNSSGTFAGSNNFIWNNGTNTLTVTGTISASTGSITSLTSTTVTSTTINATSDPELKFNISLIGDSESIIDNLNGYRFNWKSTNKPSMGLMSNEVKKVAPELVVKVGGNDAVNYNGIIAVLVEEVKALRRRVAELEYNI